MIRSRLHWTQSLRPLVAGGLLFLTLPACAPQAAHAAAPSVSPSPPANSSVNTPRVNIPPQPDPAPAEALDSTPLPPTPVTAPAPASDPVQRPTTEVAVTGFETGSMLGPDGHVSDSKTVFAATDAIRLVVLTDGNARVIRLGVTWLGPDATRIDSKEQELTLAGPQAVPFQLSNAAELALGSYKAEIRVDDRLVTTAEFVVR